MKSNSKIIIMMISMLLAISAAHADSTFAYFQIQHGLGHDSDLKLDLGIALVEGSSDSTPINLKRSPAITIPLYSNTNNSKTDQLYLNGDSQSLCQRNRVACVTLGAVIGAGAIYLFSESNRYFDSGNVDISINTKAEGPQSE